MSLQDALEEALSAVPDCNVVSYIDTSSGLVLRKAVATPVAQEILDRCASVAGAIWSGTALTAFTSESMGLETPSDGIYVLRGPRHSYIFARSAKYEDHSICFRCGVEAKPEDLVAASRQALGQIADAY